MTPCYALAIRRSIQDLELKINHHQQSQGKPYIKRKNRKHGRYRDRVEMKFELLRHIGQQDTQRDTFNRMLYVVSYFKRLNELLEEFVNNGILELQTSSMRNSNGRLRRTYVLTNDGRILFEKMEKLNELCPLDKLF